MSTRRYPARELAPLLVAGLLCLAAIDPAAAQLSDSAWPMFQNNPRHTGQSAFLGPLFPSGAPGPDDVTFWQGFDKIKTSPSIGPDGTIYVGLNFYLCAIRPDMTTKWCTRLRADVSPSSVAIDRDGFLYVGDRDNSLTKFDPVNGDKLFVLNNGTEGDIDTSPAIGADGTLYFAFAQNRDGAGIVTALNPVPNPDGTASVKWKCKVGKFINTSSPAIDEDGFIYLGDSSGGFHKFRDNGQAANVTAPAPPCPPPLAGGAFPTQGVTKVWSKTIGTKITASPVIRDAVRATDGTILSPAIVFVGSTNGLSAVRPSDGTILWTFPTAGVVDQTPALASDGSLYFASKTGPNKTFYSLATDGRLRWRYGPVSVYADLGGFPIIGADGIVYLAQSNGVYAFSPDGTSPSGSGIAPLWSYQTGNAVLSHPAIAGTATREDGGTATLYLPSSDWRLYKITSERPHGTATNQAPTAALTSSPSGIVGEVLAFDGSDSSDPDEDPLSMTWDFGDGNASSGPTVTHVYTAPGTYTVTLTVGDGFSTTTRATSVTIGAGGVRTAADTFTRGPSTALGSAPACWTAACPWEEAQGNLVLQNNELQNDLLRANHIAIQPSLVGLTHTAAAAFASVDNSPAPRLGLVLRYRDPQNYYAFYRVSGPTNALRISKVVNGVETILKAVSMPAPTLNTFFRIKAQATGATLTLSSPDGVVKATVTDTTFVGGSIGILLGSGSTSTRQYRADDFSGTAQ